MKNKFLLLLILGVTFFSACSDDDDNDRPWVGKYNLAKYTVSEEGVTGAFHMEYVLTNEETGKVKEEGNLYRVILGAIMPQVLQSVTLENDGNVRAMYYGGDNAIQFNPSWVMGSSPTESDVEALIPTSGWKESPKKLAYWSERNGKFTLRLDIASIVSQVAGDGEESEMLSTIIKNVLEGNATSVKALIKQLTGVDVSSISDETVNTLLGWLKNGIPMNITKSEGHTYIYLDRAAFNPLMVDNVDGSGNNSDLMKLCMIMIQQNLIPSEYQAVVFLFAGFVQNWEETTTFNVGLNLVAQ